MELEVIDKKSKKVVWKEEHKNIRDLKNAINFMKTNTFNPDHFDVMYKQEEK